MPVLPPIAESTWARRLVGICTTRTPRRKMLAAKPGEVADHAATKRDDAVAALHAEGEQALAQRCEHRKALACFARAHHRLTEKKSSADRGLP
jgi:hypothetical protein